MEITDLVKLALEEDIPNGDLTTTAVGISHVNGTARLIAKEDLILSGTDFFNETLKQCDLTNEVRWQFEEGELILRGQVAALIDGDLVNILKAERVALNFLGHFSGIATLTRCFVDRLNNSKIKILDTRKTLPLYRRWEKKAVRDGGGLNHRMNLSDAILIKENHIRAAGGLDKAMAQAKDSSEKPIEIETTSLSEVEQAVEYGASRIMLDNMSDDEMKECLKVIPSHIEVEASGNMNLERMKTLRDLEINFVSIGALTHSAPCADFSLIFDWPTGE